MIDPEQILAQVAAAHGVRVDDIRGRRTTRDVVTARRDAIVQLTAAGLSRVEVGRAINRHHTTVVHQLKMANTTTVDPPDTKLCVGCDETLPAGAFWRRARSSDGLHTYCRDCMAERKQRWGSAPRRRGRRPAGGGSVNVTVYLSPPTLDALRTTANELRLTQSWIVEQAVRRELGRLWSSCRRCLSRPAMEDSSWCGRCAAGRLVRSKAA